MSRSRRSFRTVDLALLAGLVLGVVGALALADPSRSAVAAPPPSTPLRPAAVQPRPAATTSTTALPAIPTHPLTGEELAGPLPPRRAIAVKVDGLGGVPALHGLDRADLIVEVLVEGGLVRMIAVFHSDLPQRVGPVRSVRTSDLHVLGALGHPVLVFSGGNPRTVADTLHAPFQPFPPVRQRGDTTFWRDTSLSAPHNLFVRLDAVAAATEPDAPPPPQFERRRAGDPPLGEPQALVSVRFSGVSTTGFAWSEELGGWVRSLDGRVQRDGQGRPLVVRNVVVLSTPYGTSPYDAHSPEAHPVGSGPARVYSGGRVQEGTWVRPDEGSPWRLVAPDGGPLLLDPGRTWVELQPVDAATSPSPG